MVTGNTVVDALMLQGMVQGDVGARIPGHVLVTVHRRESWGEGIEQALTGLVRAIESTPHAHATVITHPNPVVANQVRERLAGVPRIEVVDPQPYDQLLQLMKSADVILTDSGGIQEEAPSLRVPVLIARKVTERREAVEAGLAKVVGTDADCISDELYRLLNDEAARESMVTAVNPFGDGHAAARSVQAIGWFLGFDSKPDEYAG